MKKILSGMFMIIFVFGVSSVFAGQYPHHARHSKSDRHSNSDRHNQNCVNGTYTHGRYNSSAPQYQNDAKVLLKDSNEAKGVVETYIKDNKLKGYKVKSVQSVSTKRGVNMYVADTGDASGNEMQFHINPYGYVNGPFIKTQVK